MPVNGVYKVLVVDDSISVVEFLKFVVSRRPQFSVVTAFNAEDAFGYMETEKPDIVLLDINLPRKNGLVACRELKDKYPNLPIIVITAELDPETRWHAFQAGADDFITKPFNADEITSHIRHHLHLTVLDRPV